MKFLDQLSALSRIQIRILGCLVVTIVGIIDYLTGVTISFALFYLIPIVFVSWYDGKVSGMILSVVSAAFWFNTEVGTSWETPLFVPAWNAFNRFAVFASVVWVLNALRETHSLRYQAEIDKYTRIVEKAVEGVIALDSHGDVRYMNARASQLLGFSAPELHGRPFTRFVHEGSRRIVDARRMGEHALEMKPDEIQFIRKDGSSFWTLVTSSSPMNGKKEPDGMVMLVTDISERKQAEEELKRKYEQISAMQHLSSVLARSLYADQRLEDVMKTVLYATKFDAGAVYLLEEGRNELTIRYHSGFLGELVQRWPIGLGMVGRVCQTGTAQFLDDVEALSDDDPWIRASERIRALASIPLITKDAVVGVLNIISRKPRSFSDDEKSMLNTFGKQIGVALENARLYEAARAGGEAVRRLSIDLVQIQEEERKRFARELHDGLAQLLMTMRVNAELALTHLGEESTKAAQYLREVITQVGEAETEAKEISYDLRPAILDDFGLRAAIEVHVRKFETRTGISVDLHLPDTDLRFDSVIETTMYRIVQELLANVGKHSNASLVTIQLLARSNVLALAVADNGKGFNVKEQERVAHIDGRTHNGMRNMRERAESLKGMFRVESVPGRGTEFVIEIPCTLIAFGSGVKERAIV